MAAGVKTGGRQKGSVNKKTLDEQTLQVAAAAKRLGKTFKGDAYDYLVSVYRDESAPPSLRHQAASVAIKYEREMKPQHVESVFVLTDDALQAIVSQSKPKRIPAPDAHNKIIDAEEVTD